MMEKIRFDNLFSFKYSERDGTAAAELGDKVSECVKSDRLKIVQALQEKHTLERNEAMIGNTEEILVEEISKNSKEDVAGRTRTNKIVNFRGSHETDRQDCVCFDYRCVSTFSEGEVTEC